MFKEGELHMQQYPVRTIDLEALRENVRLLRSTLPEKTKLMAVVKADAYGHGIAKVARAALEAGASALAVARTDEGAALRQAGVTAPVLVLGASSDEEIAEGVRNELTLTVCTPEMVDTLESCAKDSGLTGLMHLKIDTGMGRIGVRTEEEIRAILARLQVSPHVRLTGAFTHFADADGSDMAYTRMQFERFQQLLTLLPDGIVRHCANSAAIHRCPEAALDMVRAGISMYGHPPVETDLPLRPVMTWRTQVTFVKTVQPGDKISYGCTFTAEKPMRLATVACGYGDGYHRNASSRAQVILHGQRARVVGRICMDQMMVDVTDVPEVREDDEAILWGGTVSDTAETIARKTKNHRQDVIRHFTKADIERQLRLAEVNHCLSFEQVSDELIEDLNIPEGDFDTAAECRYTVPSATSIGMLYQGLVLSTMKDDDAAQAILDVFSSFITDEISDFNSNVYYTNPDYLRCSYLEGKMLA